MRLLRIDETGEFSLVEHVGRDTPQYAILSHTWGADYEEVTFRDLVEGTGKNKAGYRKLNFCREQAANDSLQFFWIDTCCIDKTSSAELSEAINSMFQWYHKAKKCYAYLSDVSKQGLAESDFLSQRTWKQAFKDSRWFTRGWTLQELLAPISIEFFSAEGERLGDKVSLLDEIHDATRIPLQALQGKPLDQFSIDERLSWATRRQTKREEDIVYSLLGIFNIYMPLIYGEGRKRALFRLQREIQQSLGDESPALPPTPSLKHTANFKENFTLGFHLERVHIIPHFTPRPEYMKALEEDLLSKNSAGRKVFVLYGLGGIGKTQLAIKFANDHQAEFTSIFFLDGSNRESLLEGFASIHRRISEFRGLQTPDSTFPSRGNQIHPEDMVKEVGQWFAQAQNNRWLLIFDNIDKAPSDEGGIDIVPYFPPKDHGRVLITTRLASLSNLGRGKRVGRMSDEEAIGLLDETLENFSGEQRAWVPLNKGSPTIHELLKTLDGLPLAISQTGRFINTLNLKPETYLELYTSSKREVMDMLSSDSHLQDAERGSIRTTWTTSLNLLKARASNQGPDGDYYAAYRLLQLFAYFEPSDLNYNILRHGVIGNNVPYWFQRTFSSKLKFFGVMKALLELCLVDHNVSEGTYSMHRVVHSWLCTYICGETDRELLRIAVGAISYCAPLIQTDQWAKSQQKLALHALHVLARLPGAPPNDFLVHYDKMKTEEIATVASLLGEPVKCWRLMKFDYTLIGISRLLQSCGRSREALKLISETLSETSETLDDGTVNPVQTLLRYEEIGCDGQLYQSLPGLSRKFWDLGSPSWAIKAQNLYALILESLSFHHKAIETWEFILDQSRNTTGSLFLHPTWMLFINLRYRIRDDLERKRQLFMKFETDAWKEKDKPQLAAWFLAELRQM